MKNDRRVNLTVISCSAGSILVALDFSNIYTDLMKTNKFTLFLGSALLIAAMPFTVHAAPLNTHRFLVPETTIPAMFFYIPQHEYAGSTIYEYIATAGVINYPTWTERVVYSVTTGFPSAAMAIAVNSLLRAQEVMPRYHGTISVMKGLKHHAVLVEETRWGARHYRFSIPIGRDVITLTVDPVYADGNRFADYTVIKMIKVLEHMVQASEKGAY